MNRLLLLVILVLGSSGAGKSLAQSSAVPDSLGETPRDAPSSVSADSVFAAPPDSTAVGRAEPGESGAGASADSTRGDASAGYKEALGGSLDSAEDLGPLLPPWTADAALDRAAMERLRARGLDEIVEAVPLSYLRVQGDRGFPAYYDLTPLDGGAIESFYDGVPTRSPADLDPGIWDLSAVSTGYAGRARHGAGGAMGGSSLELERMPAEWGTTILRTHFDQSKHESYLRGLSGTTPRAPRTLRLDYEEWKTEDGYNFSDSPTLGAGADYGRSKMRRWVLSGGINTEPGRISMGFGRGRRYHRGTMIQTGAVERWTGQVWFGFDREESGHHLRLRAYQLDWHDHDFIHSEERDAARRGLRATWMPMEGGPGVAVDYERWSARFRGSTRSAVPRPSHLGRVRLVWESTGGSNLDWSLSGEAAYAEHAETPWGFSGEATARWRPSSSWWLGAEGARRLRTPTLLESAGFQSFDLAGGFTLTRLARGELPFEVQDRLRALFGFPVGDQGHVEFAAERWELSEGIGWVPENNAAVDGRAYTVGGLGYTLDQITLAVALPFGSRRHGLRLDGSAHMVLGELPLEASRGAGWPEQGAFLTVRWWHDLLSERDQIRLLYRMSFQGEHYDDLLAPFSMPDDRLDPSARQDLRIALKLRDAEIFLEIQNLLDSTIEQVAGTRRRGRDLIWGLYWPFWN